MSPGSIPAVAMAPATVCMPMSCRDSPARERPARPMGVRTAVTMTASLASVMVCLLRPARRRGS